MTYLTTFTVHPKRNGTFFPVDMLRREACFPVDQESCMRLGSRARDFWQVHLGLVHKGVGKTIPNIDQWRTMGWDVIRSSILSRRL